MARRTMKPKDGLKIVDPSARTKQEAEKAVKDLLGALPCFGCSKPLDSSEAWAVEVKHGKQIPRTLLKWWGQAEQNAGDGKRPLLVLHPAGAAYADSLAVLRLADLADSTLRLGNLPNSLSLVSRRTTD